MIFLGKAFRKSPHILVAVVLFIIGFVFCFFASLFAGLSASYFLAAQPVEAQIANITAGSDGDSKATVTYMIQGKEYETMLTYYSSSMHIGDVITVYRHYSVNNRHPFVVSCTYQETPYAPPITFHSENLWDYPALQPGDWVPVYYDPSKPNIHYVQADLNLESKV